MHKESLRCGFHLFRRFAAMPVRKPELDPRTYEHRVVKVPGGVDGEEEVGIRCLFVQDPETEKAAASMCVHVGAMYDPQHRPGLAHFCEHMLFLGSEKYPGEAEYKQFLSKHGGSCNAYTSSEVTNYYFDVAAQHLAGALDIFGGFFSSPLMTEDCVSREINAVHSENARNLSNDARRLGQIRKAAANPMHPFNSFSTGNNSTLTPEEGFGKLHDELLAFHDEFYRAQNMDLVVLGKESADDLEAVVQSCFKGLKPGGGNCGSLRQLDRMAALPEAFGPNEKGWHHRVVPVKEKRSIRLDFPVPSPKSHYKSKPASYWSHLIGHEGPGSICAALKKQGWADSLSAGLSYTTSDCSLFTINVEATVDGMANRDAVIATVLAYIRLIEEAQFPDVIMSEVECLHELEFRYKDTQEPMHAVKTFATNLKWYEPEDVVSGDYLISERRADLVKSFAQHLRPENMLLYEVSKEFQDAADLKEKWYGSAYSRQKLDEEQLLKWKTTNVLPLALPSPNRFLPSDFTVFGTKSTTPGIAEIILEDPKWKLWHKQDDTFLQPKTSFIVNVLSPSAYDSPKSILMTQLYCWACDENLAEFSYEADIAQAQYGIYHLMTGVQFRFGGFNQKLSLLMDEVMKVATNPVLDSQLFCILHEKLKRQYHNVAKNQPHNIANFQYRHLLLQPHWSIEQRLAVIDDITQEETQVHFGRLFDAITIEGLIHGNTTKDQALELQKLLGTHLAEAKDLPAAMRPKQLVASLLPGLEVRMDVEHADPENPNGAAVVYWVLGDVDAGRFDAVTRVFGRVVKQPAFSELRTQQQLGYIVWSQSISLEDTRGFKMTIQSSTASPVVLYERILMFLREFEGTLEAMPEEDFQEAVDGLVKMILQPSTKMRQETARIWQEIEDQTLRFHRAEEEASQVRSVSKAEVLAMFRSCILDPLKARVVAVFVHKNGKLPEDSAMPSVDPAAAMTALVSIDTVEQFRNGLPPGK